MADSSALALTRQAYSVSIQWDVLDGQGLDVDLQAVIVDERGLIVDAVYYNNPAALDGAVGLSGDERVGAGEGDDERLWITLSKVPERVRLMIFVVAVYDGGHLRDVVNGRVIFNEEGRQMRVFPVERSGGDADIVAIVRRRADRSWELLPFESPADLGSHFLDILEPNIGDLIRREIPGAPQYQQVNFEMEKDAVIPLPGTSKVKRLLVSIGGQLRPGSKQDVDIDVSAVFLSPMGTVVGAVDSDCSALFGVEHSGDRVAGEEAGDDEVISMDLSQIPHQVRSIFLVFTVTGGCFSMLKTASVQIVDQSAVELVSYNIAAGQSSSGLVVAQIFRAKGRRWGFQAIGSFLPECHSWKDALGEMTRIFEASLHHHGHLGVDADGDKAGVETKNIENPAASSQGCRGDVNEGAKDVQAIAPQSEPSSKAPAVQRRSTLVAGLSRCQTVGSTSVSEQVATPSPPLESRSQGALQLPRSRVSTARRLKRGTTRLSPTPVVMDTSDMVAVADDSPEIGPRSFACASCMLCAPKASASGVVPTVAVFK